MKVEGEKLVFSLAAHWKRREIRGSGRRGVDKGWRSQVDTSRYLSRAPDWEYRDGLELERRSMRGGAMRADISSPMKPSNLPPEAPGAIFRRLSWSRPWLTCHLSLNRLRLHGICTCVEDQT